MNYTGATGPYGIAAGDINGDGYIDLVAANYGGTNVSVFFGQGNGTFAAHANFALGSGVQPTAVILSDLNGDGRPDIATANLNGTPNVSVLLYQCL